MRRARLIFDDGYACHILVSAIDLARPSIDIAQCYSPWRTVVAVGPTMIKLEGVLDEPMRTRYPVVYDDRFTLAGFLPKEPEYYDEDSI